RGKIDGEPTDIPGAYRVERVDEDAVAEGRIWPQSRGSQLAGLVVGARVGERTLDLCAAPGGKATQLAGEVTAVEKHPGRARELQENAARLGASNVSVLCADALELPAELREYDRALVDAAFLNSPAWFGASGFARSRSSPRSMRRTSQSSASRSSNCSTPARASSITTSATDTSWSRSLSARLCFSRSAA